jgi:hypothetical protein
VTLKRNITSWLLLFILLTISVGYSADSKQCDRGDGRQLTIVMPDGNFFNLATYSIGSTGTMFHNILVSTNQLSQILNIIRKRHNLPWRNMTVERPYPKTHTVLLWFGSNLNGEDCTLGTSDSAIPILQEILNYIPAQQQKDFAASLKKMRTPTASTK